MPKRKGGEGTDSSMKKLRSEENRDDTAQTSNQNEPIEHQQTAEPPIDEDVLEFKAQIESVLAKLTEAKTSNANQASTVGIEELDQIIKKSIKKDKAVNGRFKHAPILFQALFKHLLDMNHNNNNNTLCEQYVTKLNLIRIDTLPVETLSESMRTFAEHVIKTNKLNERVGQLVATMGQLIDKCATFTHSLAALFENIFSKCRFDENLLIQLLFIINRMVLHTNHHIAESFVYKMFKIESSPDEEQTPLSAKFNSISPANMSKLVHETILFLATYQIKKSVRVYERLFHIFLNLKTNTSVYLEHKSQYVKAEKDCVEHVSAHLGRNDQRNRRFLQAFKNILRRYSTSAVLNRFTYSLYLALSTDMPKAVRVEFDQVFMEHIESYVDMLHRCQQTKWIQKSTKHNYTQKDLGNLLKFTRQIEVLPVDKALNGLKELAFRLLDKCYEKQQASVSILRSIASNILEDLFKNCKRSRELIVHEIFERTTTPNNESVSHEYCVYLIDRFELIFNAKQTLTKLFFDKPTDTERAKLNKCIQSHLLAHMNRVHKQLVTHSQNAAFTQQFQTISSNLKQLFTSVRCFFFTCSKRAKSTFDELLSFLKAQCESKTTDARTRQLCFQLLVVILKALNMNNPFEKTSASANNTSSNSLIDNLYKNFLKENLKYSKELVSFCKVNLHKQNAASKCFLYESLSSITKVNGALSMAVSELLKQQLESVVIQVDSDYLIDMSQCVCASNLHLIEPVDVLLNCVDLCTRNSDNEHNASLKVRLSQLFGTYLSQEAKQIFGTYKEQLGDWFHNDKFHQDPINHLKLKHQLQLGIIDAFMEHMFMNELFDKINKLLEFHQCTSSLMGTEIEELMTSCLQSGPKAVPTSSQKRKMSDVNKAAPGGKSKTALKRFKASTAASASTTSVDGESNKENDENEMAVRSQPVALDKRKRRPLADKTNIFASQTTNKSTPSGSQQLRTDFGQNILRNFTFSNIQFEHVPRISFNCLLKMIQFQFCSPDEGLFKSTKLFDSSALLRNIVEFMMSEKFMDFVQKNLDKKMKSLLKNEHVYNPEALDEDQLFAVLSQLWTCFFQRINGTERTSGASVYSANLSQRFQPHFFSRSHRFIQFCASIWTFVQQRCPQKLDELIKSEREHYDFGAANSSSQKTSGFKDSASRAQAYARFIFNCCQSVNSHLKPSPSNAIISNKCCAGLLSLVYEIMQASELSENVYDQLYTWLIGLLDTEMISETEVLQVVFKLLVHVCAKRNSPLLLVKHFSIEYFNYVFLNNDEEIYDETETETTVQFSFMSSTNQMDILHTLYKKAIESIDEIRWSVESNEWFNRTKLVALMCAQLECMTHTLINLLRSVSKLDTAELALKLVDTFYSFMNYLIQTDLFVMANDAEMEMLKSLISSIGLRLHNQLPTQLNRIKDLILTDELQREEKANSSEILKIIGYKQQIRHLIENIDAFEQELIQISKARRTPSLLKDFKVFIYDFQFSLSESKVTRTISGQQINKILVSSQSYDL